MSWNAGRNRHAPGGEIGLGLGRLIRWSGIRTKVRGRHDRVALVRPIRSQCRDLLFIQQLDRCQVSLFVKRFNLVFRQSKLIPSRKSPARETNR